jgi:hypothetical protein
MAKTQRRLLPRAPLTTDRRTGGAHRTKRELSAREELTLRLNEMAQDGLIDHGELTDINHEHNELADDYLDFLLDGE